MKILYHTSHSYIVICIYFRCLYVLANIFYCTYIVFAITQLGTDTNAKGFNPRAYFDRKTLPMYSNMSL